MDVAPLLEGLALVLFGAVVVVGGAARLRGRRSSFDRIGDALGAAKNVDGLPHAVLGNPPEVPAPHVRASRGAPGPAPRSRRSRRGPSDPA